MGTPKDDDGAKAPTVAVLSDRRTETAPTNDATILLANNTKFRKNMSLGVERGGNKLCAATDDDV